METSAMEQVMIFASTTSVIVMVLMEVLKRTSTSFDKGGKNNRFLPLISIVVGVVVGALASPFTDIDLQLRLWSGFFGGAGACGLYGLTKAKWKA